MRTTHWLLLTAAGTIVAGALTTVGQAQPPGPGPKGKGPPPPPAAEYRSVRGTVREFTTAPAGEVDGLILTDGTVIHWPPHLQDQFTSITAKGDRIRAGGYSEVGPAGERKLEVSTLTNVGSNRTAVNPDRRPPPGQEARAGAGNVEDRVLALEEKVDRLAADVERLMRRE